MRRHVAGLSMNVSHLRRSLETEVNKNSGLGEEIIEQQQEVYASSSEQQAAYLTQFQDRANTEFGDEQFALSVLHGAQEG